MFVEPYRHQYLHSRLNEAKLTRKNEYVASLAKEELHKDHVAQRKKNNYGALVGEAHKEAKEEEMTKLRKAKHISLKKEIEAKLRLQLEAKYDISYEKNVKRKIEEELTIRKKMVSEKKKVRRRREIEYYAMIAGYPRIAHESMSFFFFFKNCVKEAFQTS